MNRKTHHIVPAHNGGWNVKRGGVYVRRSMLIQKFMLSISAVFQDAITSCIKCYLDKNNHI